MDNTRSENEGMKISRREMLRLAALGTAGIVASASGVGQAFASTLPAPAAARLKQEKAKLRVQVNQANAEKPFFDIFQEKFPDIEVEILEVTGIDHEEIASKILSMVAAGQAPDVGYAATEALELYAGKELAAPLTERVKADATELAEYFTDVHPSLVEAMMYEGDLYELPRDFNAANMYFNTGLLKEAGLEVPKADWDKDEFYRYASTMTKKSASGETEIYN